MKIETTLFLQTMFRSTVTVLSQSSRAIQQPLSTRPLSVGGVRLYHQKVKSFAFVMKKMHISNTVLRQVIDHYERPRNVGSFPKTAEDVGTGLVGAPACGDVMKLQIKVDDKTGKIVDVKFKTFGCGSAIASSSFMTERVRGMTLEEAVQIKNTEIAQELSLPPVKLHCSSKFSRMGDFVIASF